jgi:intraflagellar transport protein 172
MQLRYLNSALAPTEGMAKVTAIAWTSNNQKLAVVTVDRIVHLFDAVTGERKDKFSTKAAEKVRNKHIHTLLLSCWRDSNKNSSNREQKRMRCVNAWLHRLFLYGRHSWHVE